MIAKIELLDGVILRPAGSGASGADIEDIDKVRLRSSSCQLP